MSEPQLYQEKLRGYFQQVFAGINLNIDSIIESTLSQERAQEKLALMKEKIPSLVKGREILEIGSGCGIFLSNCTASGFKCFGIEPDEVPLRYTRHILRKKRFSLTVLQGAGESLPFKDDSFDIVTSFQVLEHVHTPKKVLHEAIRVLKTGGYLYFVVPNYYSFWEGHYGVLWFPFLAKSKFLARIYLKLLGKDICFIESINFVTPNSVLSDLNGTPLKIISLGEDVWEHKMRGLEFSTWGLTSKLVPWLKFVSRMKITSLAIFLGKKLGFYYPIILLGKKCLK